MKFLTSFAIVLIAAAGIAGQQPSSTPPPQPRSTPATPPPSATPVPAHPIGGRSVDMRRLDQFPLNRVSDSDLISARVTRLTYIIAPLYKKPSGKDLAAIQPERSIVNTFSDFLRLPDTGIFRLVPDSGCVFSDRVVSVKDECLKYSFPGAGNSYSFRTDGYRLRHLADITYTGNKLRITGIFMHGIAVDLGNVPIESASLTTDGIGYLTEFKPSTEPADVLRLNREISGGLTNGNFVYAKEVDPVADRTYAIRSIAYRGKVVRSVAGIRYNELDFDKRRDVIVVFRVVEMNESGVTIVWRKLADIESPKIKMPKPDKDEADNGEAN